MNRKFIVALLFLAPSLKSCFLLPKCEEYKKHFLWEETNLVIQKTDTSIGRDMNLEGYNPLTKKPAKYNTTEAFYIEIKRSAHIGDTLFKKRNAAWFLLKKRRINIKFEAQCNGDDYLASEPDTLSKNEHPL